GKMPDLPNFALAREEITRIPVSQYLTDSQKMQLNSLLYEYLDVFAQDSSDLGRTNLVQHKIPTGDSPPIKKRSYHMSPTEKEYVVQEVEKMLKQGVVTKSSSPWNSPIVLVKKK